MKKTRARLIYPQTLQLGLARWTGECRPDKNVRFHLGVDWTTVQEKIRELLESFVSYRLGEFNLRLEKLTPDPESPSEVPALSVPPSSS